MKTIAARAEFWTLEAEGWKALAPGVKRCQHRLRRSMAVARSAKSEEPVHEFRKRAKDHWYQTLLLRAAFPEMMEAYAEAGERLGNDLGLWRDLGLLEEAVGALPAHVLPADQLSRHAVWHCQGSPPRASPGLPDRCTTRLGNARRPRRPPEGMVESRQVTETSRSVLLRPARFIALLTDQ
jgi:hypothetical protein